MPKKIIAAVIIISLLAIIGDAITDEETNETPNLLFGLGLVGLFNAINVAKEIKNSI